MATAVANGMNLRRFEDGVGLSFDETTSEKDLNAVFSVFADGEAGFTAQEVTSFLFTLGNDRLPDSVESPACNELSAQYLTEKLWLIFKNRF